MQLEYILTFIKNIPNSRKTLSKQAGIKMDIQNNRIETFFKLSANNKSK